MDVGLNHPYQTDGWLAYQQARGRKTCRVNGVAWFQMEAWGPFRRRWYCFTALAERPQAPGEPYRCYHLQPGTGYSTVVHDLQCEFNAKQRKAVRAAGDVAVTGWDWGYVRGLTSSRWRGLQRRPPNYVSPLMVAHMGSDAMPLVAYRAGKPIGGLGVIGHGEWMTELGAWGEGGDALKAAAIRWGQDKGYLYYDLGGAGGTPGIQQFKRKWGESQEFSLWRSAK